MIGEEHPRTNGLSPALTVLVLDDSPAQRNMVCAFLRKWGHRAISTGDPVEALARARDPEISLILCDWMMPEMTGPEFCRCLRAEVTETYPYVLLLTSKNERSAVPEGLAAGADDFLSKPVRPPELQARMNAGARIVAMQRELRAKNGLLETTLDELQQVYSAIDRDLDEARRLQMASLQDRHCARDGGDVSLLLEASGHVGGDMVGHFKVCDYVVGLYSIDVSGHGVASAMLAARIAGMLSEASPDQNIAMQRGSDGAFHALSPELAAARMNALMLKEVQTDRYFTICIAFANLRSGAVRMVQAGHPHPMILRAGGQVDVIGDGGPPVGLLPDMPFTSFEAQLSPGDRLLLYSDGLTECPDPSGTMLDDAGLITLMRTHRDLAGTEFLDALRNGLVGFAGHEDFPDDLSALLFSYRGRG
ncbi:fused response regulator/phosphatase [Gymnodinialimonas ceratoperidinii]|uniref:Fused response regulator/phosphatase n=2 Tax=Gymnodinialimonas ceratoperidinii TaxID=2856823 RepID=A0A8F6TZ10_9RHOB|nr:fused response regulator/phosphatase [Gymnodinialimonas ceratoperidinii]